MPGTEVSRKQHTWGGAAGIAVLVFALVYRFFPGLLHLQPMAVQSQVTTTAPASNANRATPWSVVGGAVKRKPAANVEADVGTSEADAIRMGPPAPTTKEVA